MKMKNKNIIVITILIAFSLLLYACSKGTKGKENVNKYNDMRMMVNTLYFSIVFYNQAYGECPPDLGALFDNGFLEEGKCYVSFSSNTVPPKNGDDIRNGQCDYYYFGKGKKYIGPKSKGEAYPLLALKPGIYKDYFIYTTSNAEAKESKSPPPKILKLIKDLKEKK